MKNNPLFTVFFKLVLLVVFLAGCTAPAQFLATESATPSVFPSPILQPTIAVRSDGLTEDEADTLSSLEKINDHPLYTMFYSGSYDQGLVSLEDNKTISKLSDQPAWACSLFAALGETENKLYGRNFDWQDSPAVLLFTDPPDGYASVSMVDIAYLGFQGELAQTITDLPLSDRKALLNAPYLPFDGMNEHGLVVGMAAVSNGNNRPEPDKETIDSLMVIRLMLDQARYVEEAVTILQTYNIDWGNGPAIHYLIADAAGKAVLAEFYQGRLVLTANESNWHLATNFIRASVGISPEGICSRYDTIYQKLSQTDGQLSEQQAIGLLSNVSQGNTQWSVVYGLNTGVVNVVMGRQFDKIHTFKLEKK
jgi:hypothetical protein